MTMMRLAKRAVVAMASAAIMGGVVVGASGSASAASQPVEHTRSSAVGSEAGTREEGWEGHHPWRHAEDGRLDYRRDGQQHGYHQEADRRDGHRLYVWDGDRRVDVTSLVHNAGADRWYVDQLLQAQS
jgi:hypothetical protein